MRPTTPTAAARTPRPAPPPGGTTEGRDVVVDAVRVAAVLTVAVGHALVAAVAWRGGGFVAEHVLGATPWTQWLTFGFQIYLDIRHILGENVDRGFKDLCQEAQPVANSTNRLLEFHREMGVVGLADRVLRQVSEDITDWLEHDEVSAIIDRETRLVHADKAEPIPPNYHLERDPLWCGLLLYNFRMAAHEFAVVTANSWTFVIASAHLYNSLRQTEILRCEWPPSSPSARLPCRSASKLTPIRSSSCTRAGDSSQSTRAALGRAALRPATSVSLRCSSGESSSASAAAIPPWAQ